MKMVSNVALSDKMSTENINMSKQMALAGSVNVSFNNILAGMLVINTPLKTASPSADVARKEAVQVKTANNKTSEVSEPVRNTGTETAKANTTQPAVSDNKTSEQKAVNLPLSNNNEQKTASSPADSAYSANRLSDSVEETTAPAELPFTPAELETGIPTADTLEPAVVQQNTEVSAAVGIETKGNPSSFTPVVLPESSLQSNGTVEQLPQVPQSTVTDANPSGAGITNTAELPEEAVQLPQPKTVQDAVTTNPSDIPDTVDVDQTASQRESKPQLEAPPKEEPAVNTFEPLSASKQKTQISGETVSNINTNAAVNAPSEFTKSEIPASHLAYVKSINVAQSSQSMQFSQTNEGSTFNSSNSSSSFGSANSSVSGISTKPELEFKNLLQKSAAPKNADQAETIEKIVQTAKMRHSQGKSSIKMMLNPPQLGTLKMDIVLKEGVLYARLETETAAAKHLLLNNIEYLKESLEEQGIAISQFDVDVNPGWQGSFASENASYNKEHYPLSDDKVFELDSENQLVEEGAVASSSLSKQLVDVFA